MDWPKQIVLAWGLLIVLVALTKGERVKETLTHLDQDQDSDITDKSMSGQQRGWSIIFFKKA